MSTVNRVTCTKREKDNPPKKKYATRIIKSIVHAHMRISKKTKKNKNNLLYTYTTMGVNNTHIHNKGN